MKCYCGNAYLVIMYLHENLPKLLSIQEYLRIKFLYQLSKMKSVLYITCSVIWSCISGQGESRYPSQILPKSSIALGEKKKDTCQDDAKLVFQHGNVKISYEGVASTCSWTIRPFSQTKFSVMVYQINKAELSKSPSECNGLLKFPGLGYRCNMNARDCFIYTTEENTCNDSDIVQSIKEKLQCAHSIITTIPKKDMSSLSFTTKRANTFQIRFEITTSYHDIVCDGPNRTTIPGSITHLAKSNATSESTNSSTNVDYTYNNIASGKTLGSPRMVGFLMLTTLPVIIAIIGITVYAIRRSRSTPKNKAVSTGHSSEVTHESILPRELNEYVQTECIVEYEMQQRNSFISFPDSENQSDEVPYTYKNNTPDISEKYGYLIPTKNDDGYIAPPDEQTSINSEVRYVVPPEENDIQETSVYNDDPFDDNENPYEVVRDVYYRSESYSEN